MKNRFRIRSMSSGFPSYVIVFDSPEQVATAAAERFVDHASRCIREKKSFAVALSGGSTPKLMYRLLAQEPFGTRIAWQHVHIFFGDERNVSQNDPDSNYGMAHEALISKVPIPPGNVHPVPEAEDVNRRAESYEREMKLFFKGCEWPQFDLVLLGMGEDGHTASLFPQTAALHDKVRWVSPNVIEQSGTSRITLTIESINAAANVEFLITGSKKASTLAAVICGSTDYDNLPAQLVQPYNGRLTWLVDRAAAAYLTLDESEKPKNEDEN